jgi:hypothetical protein
MTAVRCDALVQHDGAVLKTGMMGRYLVSSYEKQWKYISITTESAPHNHRPFPLVPTRCLPPPSRTYQCTPLEIPVQETPIM